AVESGRAGVEVETTWVDLSRRLGRPERALALCGRLVEQYPDSLAIAEMWATLLEAAGELREAVGAWRHVVARWPEETGALLPLGRLLAWTGDLEGAEAALARYLESHPGDPEGERLLARVLGWRWKWDEASRLLDDALRRHPDDNGLRELKAQEREFFAPRLEVRPSFWDDSEDYVRGGVATTFEAVLDHHVVVKAREEWSRFHMREEGFPVVRRWSQGLGLGWTGPDRLRIDGRYTRHDSSETGESSAFDVEARRAISQEVTGLISVGRDDVTEKYFAVLEKVRVSHAGLAVYSEEWRQPWSAGLTASQYSEEIDRLSLETDLERTLVGALNGAWHNWTFVQDEQSFLFFGPEWYSEQELSLVLRPFAPSDSLGLEVEVGVQYALGDDDYGFDEHGDFGFLSRASLEHRLPGASRLGLRFQVDRVQSDSPYNGYGGEAWLQILF
ncbi:MAG: tetratricopeptide repeat protein, partial [Planctomycetota bacterium]